MTAYKKKYDFFSSEEGKAFEAALKQMAQDNAYHTESSYSANIELYPDHVMPFVNKHMDYMKAHPTINPRHYLANLRLMTRIRK